MVEFVLFTFIATFHSASSQEAVRLELARGVSKQDGLALYDPTSDSDFYESWFAEAKSVDNPLTLRMPW